MKNRRKDGLVITVTTGDMDLLLCNLREITLSTPVFGDSMSCRNPELLLSPLALKRSVSVLPLAPEPVLLHCTIRLSTISAFVCCSELYFCPCALPLQIQTGSNSTSEWPTMDVCMHDQEQ